MFFRPIPALDVNGTEAMCLEDGCDLIGGETGDVADEDVRMPPAVLARFQRIGVEDVIALLSGEIREDGFERSRNRAVTHATR